MAQTKKKSVIKAKAKPAAKAKVSAKAKSAAKTKGPIQKAVKKIKKLIAKVAEPAPSKSAPKGAAQMKKSSSALPKASSFSSSEFTPLDDRLIIQVDEPPEKTDGGIFIPGTAAERPSRGTVLAAGPGRRNKKGVVRPLDVQIGDSVLFPQFAGQKIEIGANEFLILREDELLAITTA